LARPLPTDPPDGLHLSPPHGGGQSQVCDDQARQPPLPLQVRHQNPPGFTDIRGKGERLMMEDRILREQSIAVSAGSRLPPSSPEEGGAKTARHAQPGRPARPLRRWKRPSTSCSPTASGEADSIAPAIRSRSRIPSQPTPW